MTIRTSSAREIDTLIRDLSSPASVTRDAAVARLTVIGARAVERLIDIAQSPAAEVPTRVAAWHALEGIADPRALEPALTAFTDSNEPIAAAAIESARAFVRGRKGALVVDRLTVVVLDSARPDQPRLAALQALRLLEPSSLAPLLARLASDSSDAIRRAADGSVESSVNDPVALKQALAKRGARMPLPALLRVVEQAAEQSKTHVGAEREAWTALRASAHLVLAQRDSRIALFDLREWLESATERLPIDALSALSQVGDQSCLEAIAVAHSRSADQWSSDQLAEVFHAITAREKLTRRHAVIKKIEKRWPELTKAGRAG